MPSETAYESAVESLHALSVCPGCIQRLLKGHTCNEESFSISSISPPYSTPVCPLCFGLLHHPDLCCLPQELSVTDETALEFEDMNLREPLTAEIRELSMWAILHKLASVERTENSPGVKFTVTDISAWQSSRKSLRTVWRWLVAPQLTRWLKVPVVLIPEDLKLPDQAFDFDKNALLLNLIVVFTHNHMKTDLTSLSTWLNSVNDLDSEVAAFLVQLDWRTKHTTPCSEPRSDGSRRGASSTATKGTVPPWHTPSRTALIKLVEMLSDRLRLLHAASLPSATERCVLDCVEFSRPVTLVLGGRYVKLSRRLPQTPWIVDSKRKLPFSVEELIFKPIQKYFGACARLTFSSSGREDVDVRCLGLGRPFLVQIEHYSCLLPEVLEHLSVRSDTPDGEGDGKDTVTNGSRKPVNLLGLASLINRQAGGKVFVRDLQLANPEEAGKAVKNGELDKSKCYRAICRCPLGGLTQELIDRLAAACTPPLETVHWPPTTLPSKGLPYASLGPINLAQNTPVRVLHRRPLLRRSRTVHSLYIADYTEALASGTAEFADFECWSKLYSSKELFLIELRCEAGTYVKEFVHGDLGRSNPSLAGVFQRQVDILALDVTAVELDWPPVLPDPPMSWKV